MDRHPVFNPSSKSQSQSNSIHRNQSAYSKHKQSNKLCVRISPRSLRPQRFRKNLVPNSGGRTGTPVSSPVTGALAPGTVSTDVSALSSATGILQGHLTPSLETTYPPIGSGDQKRHRICFWLVSTGRRGAKFRQIPLSNNFPEVSRTFCFLSHSGHPALALGIRRDISSNHR
ncbi:hypothetical protein SCOR_09665 [Sulfidibacter corallicola]